MKHSFLFLLLSGCLLSGTLPAAPVSEILAVIAQHERNQNRQDAIAECRNALNDKTIPQTSRYEILLRLASNAMFARDYELASDALEQASRIPAKDRRRESSLRLDSFRRSHQDKQYAVAEALGTSLLKQADLLDAKRKTEFYPLLIWIYCKNGNQSALDSLALRRNLPAESALELKLLAEFRKVPADGIPAVLRSLASWKTLAPAKQAELLHRSATALLLLKQESSAKKILELAQNLEIPFRRNRYSMKSVASAPPGAGGWILSGAWNKGGAGEFMPYDRAAQANLIADATAERIEAKNKNLDFYLKNTRFHGVYDEEGIHLFLISGEQELEKYRVLNSGGGALEIFLSPGMERENYYQFIIDLPGNKIDFYEKNSFHRSYRQIADFLKSETICRDGKMGTYVFLPWTFFYDVLPFDTKSNWRFNVIRWTPAGGITWGGRVHELGRMGELVWEKNPVLEQKIRGRIAEYAVAVYQREKSRLLEYWSDPELGDPDFCEASLKKAFQKLDAAIAAYRSGTYSASEFARDILPDLMEADYLAQELRKEYLSQKIQKIK